MTAPLEYVSPSAAGSGGFGQWVPPNTSAGGAVRGFVQGVVTYTVLDDLTITPMSAISSITLLNAFAVTDLAALQEKTVRLGYREVDTSIDGPRVTSPSICSIALPVSCVSSSTLRFVVNCETLLLAGPGDPQGDAAVQCTRQTALRKKK